MDEKRSAMSDATNFAGAGMKEIYAKRGLISARGGRGEQCLGDQ